jgi:hypothetical protein
VGKLNLKKLGRDKKRARKKKEEGGGGQKLIRRPQEGCTIIAVCPPNDEMDGLPYVKADQHFNVGGPGNKAPVFSLAEDNDGVWNPETLRQLDEINEIRRDKDKHVVDIEEGMECPVQEILEGSDPDLIHISEAIDDARADRMKRKDNHFWVYAPLRWATLENADKGKFEDVKLKEQRPFLLPAPPTAHLQLVEKIEEVVRVHKRDPTDPKDATLLKIKYFRGANKIMQYDVEYETESLVTPVTLPKPLRAAIKKMCVVGGEADPFRFIAGTVKDAEQIIDLIKGSVVIEEEDDDDKPGCWGDEDEYDPKDKFCKKCSFKDSCKTAAAGDDDDDDDEPEPEPEPEPKRKKKRKKAKKPDPEPEPDDEDDDEDDIPDFDDDDEDDDEDADDDDEDADDDDDEDANDEDDDDEDDDDEDDDDEDDDDEDEEPPFKKPKSKPKGKSKSKAKPRRKAKGRRAGKEEGEDEEPKAKGKGKSKPKSKPKSKAKGKGKAKPPVKEDDDEGEPAASEKVSAFRKKIAAKRKARVAAKKKGKK